MVVVVTVSFNPAYYIDRELKGSDENSPIPRPFCVTRGPLAPPPLLRYTQPMSDLVHRLTCAWCGRVFGGRLQGRATAYCSTTHRVAAHRARRKAEAEALQEAALDAAFAALLAEALQEAAIEDGPPCSSTPPT